LKRYKCLPNVLLPKFSCICPIRTLWAKLFITKFLSNFHHFYPCFLFIASFLSYIKSKALLPSLTRSRFLCGRIFIRSSRKFLKRVSTVLWNYNDLLLLRLRFLLWRSFGSDSSSGSRSRRI
jgi:hypothetical protein